MTIIDLNYIKKHNPKTYELIIGCCSNSAYKKLEKLAKEFSKKPIRFNEDVMLDPVSYKIMEIEEEIRLISEEKVKQFEKQLEVGFY